MKLQVFPNTTKPLCVFGALDTDNGRAIADEMLQWLVPHYEVHVVWHDGSQFEQPALRYMQDLCKERNVPCLYLHTKGAWNSTRMDNVRIRAFWKKEFTERQEEYFDAVDCARPSVACPFTGDDGTTWYNAFVVNAAAMRVHPEIRPNANRMKFERLFVKRNEVRVCGMVSNAIHREKGDIDKKILAIIRQHLNE
ncbi:MAG: hypothetical protein MJZ64_00260 [Paludibacteraceae bacterium]|nr:hypothetical protein [Paludibacteraceae bacterium]